MFEFHFKNIPCNLNIKKHYIDVGEKRINLNSNPKKNNTKIYYKISNKCNLSCIYCFQHNDKKPETISPIKNYKNVIKENINRDDVDIIVFGGEPLLDINKSALEFIFSLLDHNKQLSFFTNGCFSTNMYDLIKKFSKHIRHLVISIDGPEIIHNSRRVSNFNTYKTIISNAVKLKEQNIKFIFQINLDKNNILMIEELLSELDLIFNLNNINIMFNRVLGSKETLEEIEIIKIYHKMYKKYPSSNLILNSVVYKKLSSFITNEGIDRPRCGIGRRDMVFDFSTEKIYSCPQSVNTVIGSFTLDEVNINKNIQDEMYNISYKNCAKCNNCDYINFCSYGCFLENEHTPINCKVKIEDQIRYILTNFNDFFTV